jgi:hypothetical protein
MFFKALLIGLFIVFNRKFKKMLTKTTIEYPKIFCLKYFKDVFSNKWQNNLKYLFIKKCNKIIWNYWNYVNRLKVLSFETVKKYGVISIIESVPSGSAWLPARTNPQCHHISAKYLQPDIVPVCYYMFGGSCHQESPNFC